MYGKSVIDLDLILPLDAKPLAFASRSAGNVTALSTAKTNPTSHRAAAASTARQTTLSATTANAFTNRLFATAKTTAETAPTNQPITHVELPRFRANPASGPVLDFKEFAFQSTRFATIIWIVLTVLMRVQVI